MRLIKNGTGAISNRRKNSTQEAFAVNIPPDAELDRLFSFRDDPDFLVGCGQGRAELRQLVLGSLMLEDSAAGSGPAAAARTGGVETTARTFASTQHRCSTFQRQWVRSVLAGAAAVLAVIAFAIEISTSNAPLDDLSERIVVAVPGGPNEPRPDLNAITWELRSAADSGANQVELIAANDGVPRLSFPLAPRPGTQPLPRHYGAIETNIHEITLAIRHAPTASEDGLDPLTTISNAVRGSGTGTLVIASSGLSTRSELDLRQIGWDTDPHSLAVGLRTNGALPDLSGWKVIFVGLGDTAGTQDPLTEPIQHRLAAYWTAILSTAGASSVDIRSTLAPSGSSESALAGAPRAPYPAVHLS